MEPGQKGDAVDIAARAWMATLAMFSTTQLGGFYRKGPHGTSELITGAPIPLLNGVFSTAREADALEVADFATSPRLRSVPWSIQVRGTGYDPRITGTAAEHGLAQQLTLPFMIKDLTVDDTGAVEPDGVRVRRVSSTEGDLYRTTMATGYEGPVEIFGVFSAPAVLDHVDMRAYVAELAGVPVATSFGVLVDDLVGVFNIAVAPQYRRRGYGRAASTAVLREAYQAGARTAFLHASPMGVPLYQSMGFRLAENWTIFTS